MRRFIVVLAIAMAGCVMWAQEDSGGLSPKAGAYSASLYTNVYFSFNLKVPEKWNVTWVAQAGSCGKECMLLDVRCPTYPKSMQMIQVTAEASKPQATSHEAAAGAALLSMGAKKLAEPRELVVNGLTFYRTDYRSQLANADLFQSLLVMPGKDYSAVFSFAANNRRELDVLVGDFGKAFSKMGAVAKQN